MDKKCVNSMKNSYFHFSNGLFVTPWSIHCRISFFFQNKTCRNAPRFGGKLLYFIPMQKYRFFLVGKKLLAFGNPFHVLEMNGFGCFRR